VFDDRPIQTAPAGFVRGARAAGLALAATLCWTGSAAAEPDPGSWNGAPDGAWEVSGRGSVHGHVRSIDEDRGVALIESDDAVTELRATPRQLAALAPDERRDFTYVRFDESKWLADPAPIVLERGPTVEYVVGAVAEVDLREGYLRVDGPEGNRVALQAHPQAIAGLHEHQEVVVAAERIGPGLWVVAVREPDPAELLAEPTVRANPAELLRVR
jgi:hypothetical protein